MQNIHREFCDTKFFLERIRYVTLRNKRTPHPFLYTALKFFWVHMENESPNKYFNNQQPNNLDCCLYPRHA